MKTEQCSNHEAHRAHTWFPIWLEGPGPDVRCPGVDREEAAFDAYYARGGQGMADDVWRRIAPR